MPRGNSAQRGYGPRWRRYRAQFLASNPLCAYCRRDGKLTPATVVDHIRPHKGDESLFWDPRNHQSLCKSCHDSAKQTEEKRGYDTKVDASGWPVDPRHPANQGRGGSKV